VYNPVTDKCQCASGFSIIQGKCGTCKANYIYEPSIQDCIPVCKVN